MDFPFRNHPFLGPHGYGTPRGAEDPLSLGPSPTESSRAWEPGLSPGDGGCPSWENGKIVGFSWGFYDGLENGKIAFGPAIGNPQCMWYSGCLVKIGIPWDSQQKKGGIKSHSGPQRRIPQLGSTQNPHWGGYFLLLIPMMISYHDESCGKKKKSCYLPIPAMT